MTTLQAISRGFRRTVGSLEVVLLLWLVNALAAAPAAWIVASTIEDAIGSSVVQEEMRSGFDMTWYGEYKVYASGLAKIFTPTVLGVGAFLDNLQAWVTGGMFTRFAGVVVIGAIYAMVWLLLLGGVVERYAHPDETRSFGGFFRAGGRFFFRFVRLAAISGMLYFLIYRLHHRVYDAIGERVRDVTTERTVLLYALLAVSLTAVLLATVHVCFTYAKAATVVDDRRSMFLAAVRGIAFVIAHPFRTFGVYLVPALVSVVLLVLYGLVAPGAGQTTRTWVIVAFAIGQAFLIARLMLRLTALGGAVTLYRALTVDRALDASGSEPELEPAPEHDAE